MLRSKENSFAGYVAKKVVSAKEIQTFAMTLKGEGKQIVTLNGTFDLLHPGHLAMIYEAKAQGDCLWMLLNSDASIQALKGDGRPINPLEVRIQHLAALGMVDYVSCFDEIDPINVLEKIQPSVHVNGSEYGQECIEAQVVKKHGGRVHIIDLIPGYSSSNLIKKIRSICV